MPSHQEFAEELLCGTGGQMQVGNELVNLAGNTRGYHLTLLFRRGLQVVAWRRLLAGLRTNLQPSLRGNHIPEEGALKPRLRVVV